MQINFLKVNAMTVTTYVIWFIIFRINTKNMIECGMMFEKDMFTSPKTVHKSLISHHPLNSVFTFALKTLSYSIHLVYSSFFNRQRIRILHSIQVRSHGGAQRTYMQCVCVRVCDSISVSAFHFKCIEEAKKLRKTPTITSANSIHFPFDRNDFKLISNWTHLTECMQHCTRSKRTYRYAIGWTKTYFRTDVLFTQHKNEPPLTPLRLAICSISFSICTSLMCSSRCLPYTCLRRNVFWEAICVAFAFIQMHYTAWKVIKFTCLLTLFTLVHHRPQPLAQFCSCPWMNCMRCMRVHTLEIM